MTIEMVRAFQKDYKYIQVSIPFIDYRLVILSRYLLIVLVWHEQLEIFNTMVFIKCNYEVVDWLLNKSIILFYVNTYIKSLFFSKRCDIYLKQTLQHKSNYNCSVPLKVIDSVHKS